MKKRIGARGAGAFLAVLLFGAAFWILHHQLQTHRYRDIRRCLREIPRDQLLLAGALTLLSYIVLTGYDVLALRYVRFTLGYGRTALASFIGYVFSHNIGLSVLGGTAVRFRLYTAWGLSSPDITRVVAFCTLTFWLGLFTLAGIVFLTHPMAVPSTLHLPFATTRPAGAFLLAALAIYLLWASRRREPLRIRGWEFPLPPPRLTLLQIAISTADWLLAACVLYVLLPSSDAVTLPSLLNVFLLAQVAGLISHVPGGIGVFETVVLLLLPLPGEQVMASLLAYRAVYYLAPLVLAVLMLAGHEALRKRKKTKRALELFGRWVPAIAPRALSILAFIGGAVLVFSGAAPPVASRLEWVGRILPLPALEASHFLASLAGAGLLLLAGGLQQRLDGAYLLSCAAMAAGIFFSLLKGLDYEQAAVLAVMLAALLPCRRHFYRKASLLHQVFTPGWIAAILIVIAGSIWLGVFSHRHLEYSNDLWWKFSLHSQAPRFLRASVGIVGATMLFAFARLLRAAPSRAEAPSAADLEQARAVLSAVPKTQGNLALLGDKSLLFNEPRTAFIMYGIEGKSWVALGDPVGPPGEMTELVWNFRELCDRNGGWPVFYQVETRNLPLYVDLGLTLLKLGEEAQIPLAGFSMEGSSRKRLRQSCNRLEREGCLFRIVPREEVPSLLPELQRVSDDWLASKNTREKRFSLGYFDPAYLGRFPAAVVRKGDGIVAFANLLEGAGREELSVDLMRYSSDAPQGIMDYLFLQLMLWGKAQGYQRFNLGMAPLSGLENRALAPLWNRLGSLVFRHGEHFYSFQGLRAYKEKFDPEWSPKYLACPGGLALPAILTNISALISGSIKGTLAK